MKWSLIYFLGYLVVIGGLLAALAKLGVLAKIGTGWTVIGLIIALGIGVMMAIARGGTKNTIEIDRK
jgi:hypothetical protein